MSEVLLITETLSFTADSSFAFVKTVIDIDESPISPLSQASVGDYVCLNPLYLFKEVNRPYFHHIENKILA